MNLVTATVVTLSLLTSTNLAASPNVPAGTQSTQEKIIELGKDAVRERLKDPESANFRNLNIHKGRSPVENTYYVCGEVNSKNGFGGYAGFAPFQSLVFFYAEKGKGMTGHGLVWSESYDQAKWVEMQSTNCVN